jgi:hypothetical protein
MLTVVCICWNKHQVQCGTTSSVGVANQNQGCYIRYSNHGLSMSVGGLIPRSGNELAA